MNQYITGAAIKILREQNNMTQNHLAKELNVSDKTISKWENGRGYPDITMLESIAAVFRITVTELLSGTAIQNKNISGNMLRAKFYVCPICGNIIHSLGQAVISCHGINLSPLEAEYADEKHLITVNTVEDEYFVQIHHDMSKKHYISFIAGVSDNSLQLIKLYPEGNAESRLKIRGTKRIFFYCNRDGLYYIDAKP